LRGPLRRKSRKPAKGAKPRNQQGRPIRILAGIKRTSYFRLRLGLLEPADPLLFPACFLEARGAGLEDEGRDSDARFDATGLLAGRLFAAARGWELRPVWRDDEGFVAWRDGAALTVWRA
jgi:hypothetical protein